MLPGPGDSWRSYQPILGLLPHSVRAIAVSQRGHGESDKPETGYRVEDFAADVVPLLDALNIERAVLAGHRVHADAESRPRIHIASQDCSSKRSDDAPRPRAAAPLRRDCGHQAGRSHQPGFARSFVVDTSSENVAPGLVYLLVEEILAVPARVWKQTFAGLLEYDDRTELPRIETPTLLVWGDADALVSRAIQDRLAGAIPDAEFLVYPGVGHTPRWDDPVRFSRRPHDVRPRRSTVGDSCPHGDSGRHRFCFRRRRRRSQR